MQNKSDAPRIPAADLETAPDLRPTPGGNASEAILHIRHHLMSAPGGIAGRISAGLAAAKQRAGDISLTDVMLLSAGDMVRLILDAAIHGRIWEDGTFSATGVAEPLHPDGYQFRSRVKRCANCEGDVCKQRGKFHDITFPVSIVPGSASDAKARRARGLEDRVWKVCEVDRETGMFRRRLSAIDGKKLLREWGCWVKDRTGNGQVDEPAFNDAACRAQNQEVKPLVVTG